MIDTAAQPQPTASADPHKIERAVFDMYRSYPFPQTTPLQRRQTLALQICKFKFLGMEEAMRGGRILDVGCGTGRTMLVPKHYEAREYVGLDQSPASLAFAQRVAREENFDRFRPVEGSLFEMPFPDGYFDVVYSWGVLHVTPDPFRGFKEMVRVCKPGGFVALYLYNPYTHWLHNWHKRKINRLAGPDIHKRFEIAHRLHGTKPIKEMTPQDIAIFFDRYCVLLESNHSYGEMLSWFDRCGLKFWGSSPPLRFYDCFKYLVTMSRLIDEFGAEDYVVRRLAKRRGLVDLLAKLPGMKNLRPPFGRPTILHRALWQLFLLWHGRKPGASLASSLSARKTG